MKKVVTILATISLLLVSPSFSQSTDLADIIGNVFAETVVLDGNTHNAHFQDAGLLSSLGTSINQALASQLSTFPVSSSSGGFTFVYDPATGGFSRASESFGPIFAERAQTLGKGKWNAGISYIGLDFDQIDDLSLKDGDLQFQLRHEDIPPFGGGFNPFFESDLIGVSTAIDVDTETSVLFFSYGVTNKFDLAIAAPFVSVDLSVASTLTIDPLSTGFLGVPETHQFTPEDALNGDRQRALFSGSGSASGIGDVLVRLKYRFSDQGAWGLGADIRLPTGDEQDLLGTGVTQSKLYLIGSTSWGSFSPHLNVGYTVSSGDSDVAGEIPDEINYTLGFDAPLGSRVTFAADVIGRILQDAVTVDTQVSSFNFCTSFDCSTTDSVLRNELVFGRDDVNSILGAVGFRFNLVRNLLLSANALFSIGDEGLQIDGVVPTIGLDYSF